jgi:hypothetical protein
MDSEGLFWVKLWAIVGSTFVLFVAIIALYMYTHNTAYYSSWNECVAVGGQPTQQTMLGSQSSTFTCIRK